MMPGFCIVEGLEIWAFRVECLGLEFLGYRLVGEVWVEFRAGISGFGIEGLGRAYRELSGSSSMLWPFGPLLWHRGKQPPAMSGYWVAKVRVTVGNACWVQGGGYS